MSNYNSNSSGRRTERTAPAGRSSAGRGGYGSHSSGSHSGSSGRGSHSSGGSRTGHSSYSSGSRPGSSGRSSSSRYGSPSGRYGRRRRRGGLDLTKVLLGVIGVLIVILCISLAARSCKSREASEESAETSETASSGESAADGDQVMVEGIDISGLTQEQAKEAIMAQYNWNMKVTYQDKETTVGNFMEAKLDELLEQIYASDLKPGETYEVNRDNLLDAAKSEAALVAGNWNMVPKNGGISGYDKDTGKFTFTEGSNGLAIDQDKLARDMVAAAERKDYSAVIEAQVREVSPDTTASQLEGRYKTIGTYTTKTTSNSNRNENIRLACAALNGTIVNPGQSFSFNDTTGARTEAKGYKPATAYLNGEVVQEPGGGVCQVSSTLYNAVIFAGLKTTERKAHSYEPSYVTPGEDAAVSYGGPDFKFVNTSDYPIAIKTSFANQELTISVYGVPILEEGTKIRMESEKTGNIDPPAPVYEEDPTLRLDEQKVVKEGVPGTSWSTYLVTYKDGNEVSREFFHNSSYRGKSAQIKRNTSGVVLTTAGETVESSEEVSTNEALQPSESAAQGPASAGPGSATAAPAESSSAPSGEMTDPQAPGSVSPGQENTQAPQGPQESPAPTAPQVIGPTNPVIDAGPSGPGN